MNFNIQTWLACVCPKAENPVFCAVFIVPKPVVPAWLVPGFEKRGAVVAGKEKFIDVDKKSLLTTN